MKKRTVFFLSIAIWLFSIPPLLAQNAIPSACNIASNCPMDACGLICNPSMCSSNTGTFDMTTQIPGWRQTHGSPTMGNISTTGNFVGTRGAWMWARGDHSSGLIGEGIITNVNLTAGTRYIMSSYYSTGVHNSGVPRLNNVFFRLVDNVTLNTGTSLIPAVPANNELIVNEIDAVPQNTKHVVSYFEADDSYDRMWIYPFQANGLGQAHMSVRQIEMIPIPDFSLGNDTSFCSPDTMVLNPQNIPCGVFGGEWVWREVGSSTVLATGTTLSIPPAAMASTKEYVLSYVIAPDDLWLDADVANSDIISASLDSLIISDTIEVTFYTDCCAGYPDNRIYVNQNSWAGQNNGTDWANAFTRLQDALAAADSCTNVREIWVAFGVYQPTYTNDPNATFDLRSNLAIYGGFSGVETLLSERDIEYNPTTLSGAGAYHTVTAKNVDSTAILDGFFIESGEAMDYPSTHNDKGAGLYIDATSGHSSPHIENCEMIGNFAVFGGGLCINVRNGGYAGPTFINTNVQDNSAFDDATYTLGFGGGIYFTGDNNGVINVTFSGGEISGNNAVVRGGAIYTLLTSGATLNATFENIYFRGNWAGSVGGVYFESTVSNGISNVDFTNCIFSGSTANNAPAIYSQGHPNGTNTMEVTNCTFGGMENKSAGTAQVIGNDGANSVINIHNSIIWGQLGSGPMLNPAISASINVDNSIVEGGYTGTNVLNQDPLFANPITQIWNGSQTTQGDYRTTAGSPAIDGGVSGINSLPEDLGGNPRVQGLEIDMGAYESYLDACLTFDWGWGDITTAGEAQAHPQLAKDPIGNIYAAGSFVGNMNIGNTATSGATTLTPGNATTNMFLVKYSEGGDILWTKTLDAASSVVEVTGITVDGAGFSYVTGSFTQSIVVDASTTLTATSGSKDIFVIKYAPDGTPQWAVSYGSPHEDMTHDIEVSLDGTIVLIGGSFGDESMAGTASSMTMGSFTLNSSANADADLFLAQLDGNTGATNWAVGAASDLETASRIEQVELANNGDVFVMGSFENSAYFGGTSGSLSLGGGTTNMGNMGQKDVFVARYSSTGMALNAWQYATASNEEAQGLAVDNQGNHIYAVHFTAPTIMAHGTSYDNTGIGSVLLGKMTVGFVADWHQVVTPRFHSGTVGGTDTKRGLEVDELDNIYLNVTTDFTEAVRLGNAFVSIPNYYDGSVAAKYDPTGALVWAYVPVGGARTFIQGCLPLSDEKAYLTGIYKNGTVTMGNATASTGWLNFQFFVGNFEPGQCISTACGRDNFEPNDNFAAAAPLPNIGVPNTAQICVSGDEDFFQFTAHPTRNNLRVYLSDLEIDLNVEVYDASQTLLASSTHTGTDPEVITLNGTTAGATYFIKVYGPNGNFIPEGYVLKIHERATPFVTPLKWDGGTIKDITTDINGAIQQDFNLTAYPNPFTETTTIQYSLPERTSITVSLFDLNGRAIAQVAKEETQDAGTYEYRFDANQLAAGMYYIVLQTPSHKETHKLVLTK